jgi:hypothetical protein
MEQTRKGSLFERGSSCRHGRTVPRLPIFPANPVGKAFAGYWHRKLKLDLQTVTSKAWRNGVEPTVLIFELLRQADEIAASAEEQGIVL